MTYFEWVETFKKIKDGPMDYQLLDDLNNKKLDGDDYVLIRLAMHISVTIKYRLENALYNLLSNVVKSKFDINCFSMELINIKKEISYVRKMINLSIINVDDIKKILLDNINYSIDYIYNFLKEEVALMENEEFSILLEDSKKMWWED